MTKYIQVISDSGVSTYPITITRKFFKKQVKFMQDVKKEVLTFILITLIDDKITMKEKTEYNQILNLLT